MAMRLLLLAMAQQGNMAVPCECLNRRRPGPRRRAGRWANAAEIRRLKLRWIGIDSAGPALYKRVRMKLFLLSLLVALGATGFCFAESESAKPLVVEANPRMEFSEDQGLEYRLTVASGDTKPVRVTVSVRQVKSPDGADVPNGQDLVKPPVAAIDIPPEGVAIAFKIAAGQLTKAGDYKAVILLSPTA